MRAQRFTRALQRLNRLRDPECRLPAIGVVCGDVVNIKGGTYGQQQVLERASLSGCNPDVTFRANPGDTVDLHDIWLGGTCCQATNAPDDITVKGPMAMHGGFACFGDCVNIHIDGVDGGTLSIYGGGAPVSNAPTNWLIENSDWGPCKSTRPAGDDFCDTKADDDGQIELVNVHGFQFVGNTIHDFDLIQPDHFECVRTDGGSNYVWRGNKWWGCQIYGMTTTGWGGVNYIEDNWFGGGDYPNGTANGIAINAHPNQPGQTYVRFNSFSAQDTVNQDFGMGHSMWHFIGNIFGNRHAYGTQCLTGAEYKYNVYVGPKCGDSTNTGYTSLQYLNGARGPNMNYHLALTPWLADNYVPGSQPNWDLATDFDGQARSAPEGRGVGPAVARLTQLWRNPAKAPAPKQVPP